MTLSARLPLVRPAGLSHARTPLLLVSATYIGPPPGANATDRGALNSRPSTRFGDAVVTGFVSLACPNSREGRSLIMGETWAHTGIPAINAKHPKSFIIRILRWGGTREIALTSRR